MVNQTLPDSLRAVASQQLSLVTREQLATAGISADAVRRRVATSWRIVLPGVVLLSRDDLSTEQKLVAAQLHVGPNGVITGAAAAAWHGLRYAESDGRVDVLVDAKRRERSTGFVRTRRTRRGVRPLRQGPVLQLAPVARAVADACRFRSDERYATALVIESIQRGKVSAQAVADELHAGPMRHSGSLRAALTAAGTGAWSAPEADLVRLVSSSPHLPTPFLNPVLTTMKGARLPSPDLWLDDVGLAVQVHSYAHHASGPDWERTVRTDSALAEAGILRLSLTPSEIIRQPAATLRRIEVLHASRSPKDRPSVVMTPRDVVLR